MKNHSQIFFISILCLFSSGILFSQGNNDYKPILDNGYAWVSLIQPLSMATSNKYNYLVSLLQNQYFRKHFKGNNVIIDCEDDITELSKSLPNANKIDLNFMVRMIDNFYTNKENLPIPILGAYCYCIKELLGNKKDNLEAYRKKLLIIADKYSE